MGMVALELSRHRAVNVEKWQLFRGLTQARPLQWYAILMCLMGGKQKWRV